MDQLIERVLAVRAGFAPVNRTRLVINFLPIERDVFAVALHRQLLQVGRESFQVLLVGQNRRRCARRGNRCSRSTADPSAPADFSRTARCENVRPFRESPRASRGNYPGRWPASSRGRWPNPSSNVRPPSPRTQTCWPYQCRTRIPFRHWSRPPRNVSPRLSRCQRIL